ncbi:peptidase inhibitor family I36 protein [Actinoallomurus sp. CA-150999]|uniref:peptidase inhibitor family I36 protein n=1 Tax=Actinoallomurus sp. CA-150999 TaxID=3239887 RepID=UPI003D8E167B
MLSRTRHGIKLLTATALVGTAIVTGAGAASAQSDGVAAKGGPITCPPGTGCVYDTAYYKHSMTSVTHPKSFLNKCTRKSAYALADRYSSVRSYQNRTPYKMRLYDKRFKLIRTVPHRGIPGAFNPKTALTVGWICWVNH